jgi:hypothetical protein
MSEVKQKKVKLNKSQQAVQKINDLLKSKYDEYLFINTQLQAYSTAIPEGELETVQNKVLEMHAIFINDIWPILDWIAKNHRNAVQMSHEHQEWVNNNTKQTEKPKIIDPNSVRH